MSAKNVQHYLRLNYPVQLEAMPPDQGGGFRASIPILGGSRFCAAGDDEMEALRNLDNGRRVLIPLLVEQGEQLPEPPDPDAAVEQFSGRVLLRCSRRLHANLTTQAKADGVSLNHLLSELLAAGLETRRNENTRVLELPTMPLSDQLGYTLNASPVIAGSAAWVDADTRRPAAVGESAQYQCVNFSA